MTSSFSWFYRIKTSTRIETTNKKLPVGAEHVLDLHAMFDACRIDLVSRFSLFSRIKTLTRNETRRIEHSFYSAPPGHQKKKKRRRARGEERGLPRGVARMKLASLLLLPPAPTIPLHKERATNKKRPGIAVHTLTQQ